MRITKAVKGIYRIALEVAVVSFLVFLVQKGFFSKLSREKGEWAIERKAFKELTGEAPVSYWLETRRRIEMLEHGNVDPNN